MQLSEKLHIFIFILQIVHFKLNLKKTIEFKTSPKTIKTLVLIICIKKLPLIY